MPKYILPYSLLKAALIRSKANRYFYAGFLFINLHSAAWADFLCKGSSSVGFHFEQSSRSWERGFFRPGEYALKQLTPENSYLHYIYLSESAPARITSGFKLYAFEDLSDHSLVAACSEHLVRIFADRLTNIVACPPEEQSSNFSKRLFDMTIKNLTISSDKKRFQLYFEGGYTAESGAHGEINTDTPSIEIGSCSDF